MCLVAQGIVYSVLLQNTYVCANMGETNISFSENFANVLNDPYIVSESLSPFNFNSFMTEVVII